MDAEERKAPGYPTIEDDPLSTHRDALVDTLACWWAEVGWQLLGATTRQGLTSALEPLRSHPEKHRIGRLLLPTTDNADGKKIREQRRVNERAIEGMTALRQKYQECVEWVEKGTIAISQTSAEHRGAVQAKLNKFLADQQTAKEKYDVACREQQCTEQNLDLMEAAYAQDQLLMFIDKRFIKGNYARNPLKLANAMAGLPYAHDVRFMGVWQSYNRCSKLPCDLWPHHQFELFETIQSIWNRSQASTLSIVEFFHQEIVALPKTVVRKAVEGSMRKMVGGRIDNGIRSSLLDNWSIWSRAIEASARESLADPEETPFAIGRNFTRIQKLPQTKSTVDMVLGRS